MRKQSDTRVFSEINTIPYFLFDIDIDIDLVSQS